MLSKINDFQIPSIFIASAIFSPVRCSPVTFYIAVEYNDGSAVGEKYL